MDNVDIDGFHILSEDKSAINSFPNHRIPLSAHPTYADWLSAAATLPEGDIALLTNADIILNGGLNQISQVLEQHDKLLVAATRYEFNYDKKIVLPHHKPKSSQDVWALTVNPFAMSELAEYCSVPMGVQGCDNRIAFVFHENSYSVVNPYFFVRFIHYHKLDRKKYIKGESPLDGGMADVMPTYAMDTLSAVQIR